MAKINRQITHKAVFQWGYSIYPKDFCVTSNVIIFSDCHLPECFTKRPTVIHLSPAGSLRILGGGDTGRLQVYYGGQWGTVCDVKFTKKAAKVACRTLGYNQDNACVLPRAESDRTEIGEVS